MAAPRSPSPFCSHSSQVFGPALARGPPWPPPWRSRARSRSRVSSSFSDVDDDGSGTVGLEVSFKLFTPKILNWDPKDEILKAFRLLGDDETGKISFRNFKLISDVDDDGSGTTGLQVS